MVANTGFNAVISYARAFLRDNLQLFTSSSSVTNRPLREIAQGHIRALDGLRGIAILLVLYFHFTNGYINTFNGVLYQLADLGWCGVDLFFVLSGFLITGILVDAKGDSHYFRKFYMRRVLRIFPLYYGFLFVLFIVARFAHELPLPVQRHMGEQIWLWAYLTNFDYFLTAHVLLTRLHLAHFWSLAVEEQFYLIWPAVVFCCPPRTVLRISTICIGLALLLRLFLMANHVSSAAIFNITLCRMDSLAVGALCALLVRGHVSINKLMTVARWVTAISCVGLLIILSGRGQANGNNPVMQSIGYSLLAFFFGGSLLLSLNPAKDNLISWLLTCPLLVVFGFYSYAIYVFHCPLDPVFDRWFPVNRFSSELHSSILGVEAHVLCSMVASLLIAMLSWHLYEKHFLKLKKYFVLTAKPAGPAHTRRRMHTGKPFFSAPRGVMHEFGVWFSKRPFLTKPGSCINDAGIRSL